jgi:hypothetical protein
MASWVACCNTYGVSASRMAWVAACRTGNRGSSMRDTVQRAADWDLRASQTGSNLKTILSGWVLLAPPDLAHIPSSFHKWDKGFHEVFHDHVRICGVPGLTV